MLLILPLGVSTVGDSSWTFYPTDIFNTEDKPSLAYYELYPIVMACVLRDQQWSRKRILFHGDNLATFDVINK